MVDFRKKMAQRDQTPKPRGKVRKYKTESGDLVRALDEGKSFTGCFQRADSIEITDQNTHKKKDVMRYTFRDSNGAKKVLLGAYQLDESFAEVFKKEGGQEKCQGLMMRVDRLKDTKLSGDRSMGNYEISVWEE